MYLHGLGGDGSDVKSINTSLAGQARVCTYDRVTGRHTGADSVRDLHTLLDAAGVPEPYLLVGFSFGGLLAIMYAGTHPGQVEVQSSHDIDLDHPELVIKEINRILEMA